jgi:hypothetical protein
MRQDVATNIAPAGINRIASVSSKKAKAVVVESAGLPGHGRSGRGMKSWR